MAADFRPSLTLALLFLGVNSLFWPVEALHPWDSFERLKSWHFGIAFLPLVATVVTALVFGLKLRTESPLAVQILLEASWIVGVSGQVRTLS